MFENSWLEDKIFYFISQKYVQSFDRICSVIMYFLVVGFHSEHYLTFSSQNNSFRIIFAGTCDATSFFFSFVHALTCWYVTFLFGGLFLWPFFLFFGSKDNKASASAAHNFEIKNLWKCLI